METYLKGEEQPDFDGWEQVLQWDRSQQKWATSMVASSSTEYQGPMPIMDVDRGQDAQGKGKRGKNDYQKGNLEMPKDKERKEKENNRKERKGKDRKGKGVATC